MAYKPISAGSLDKRVTIQNPVRLDDGGGGADLSYVDLVTVHASVQPGAGREFFQAKTLNPELTHMVTIRYRTGVTPAHRVRYEVNGMVRAFAIRSIADPLERHEQLILMCEEQTPT